MANFKKYKQDELCGIKSIQLIITDIQGGEHKVELEIDDMESKANNFMYQTLTHALGRTIEDHLSIITSNAIECELLTAYKAKKFTEQELSDSRYRFYNFTKSVYIGDKEYKFIDEDEFRLHTKLVESYIKVQSQLKKRKSK